MFRRLSQRQRNNLFLSSSLSLYRPARSTGCDGALPTLPRSVLHRRYYGIETGQQCRHRTLHGSCRPAGRPVLKSTSCYLQDEPFHVPQAQAYCNGEWSTWDPKITTPPGLYISSDSRTPPVLTYILQIRAECHPEASHHLQVQLAYITLNTTADLAGTPICSHTSPLLS